VEIDHGHAPQDKIVHDYMDIDEDVVWNVVTKHLQMLVEQLEPLVPEDPTA
jgi:uncharacterized protein with HEPN domain